MEHTLSTDGKSFMFTPEVENSEPATTVLRSAPSGPTQSNFPTPSDSFRLLSRIRLQSWRFSKLVILACLS